MMTCLLPMCLSLSVMVSLSSSPAQLPNIPGILQNKGTGEALRQGFQEGSISLHTVGKEVSILWTASALTNQATPPDFTLPIDLLHNARGGFIHKEGLQLLPARHFPTSCCVLDGQFLLMGLAASDGRTIIEQWSFAWPDPMPAPFTNITTGFTKVYVALPSVAQIKQIYAGNIAGKQYVRNICGIRRAGLPTVASIVQFYDSNDLYVLTLATGQLELLASGTTSGGLLGTIPHLTNTIQDSISFGDRLNQGYCYAFGSGTVGIASRLILLDADRNGSIESYVVLSDADYLAQGWQVVENYANWWLP